jgi:hypothetical protein
MPQGMPTAHSQTVRAQRSTHPPTHTHAVTARAGAPRRAHLKVVGHAAVRKDVHKQRAARPQPAADAAHELLVVLHVLKALHGYDAVVRAGRLRMARVQARCKGARVQRARVCVPCSGLGRGSMRRPPARARATTPPHPCDTLTLRVTQRAPGSPRGLL